MDLLEEAFDCRYQEMNFEGEDFSRIRTEIINLEFILKQFLPEGQKGLVEDLDELFASKEGLCAEVLYKTGFTDGAKFQVKLLEG